MSDKGGTIYFKDGQILAESGDARIYKMNNYLFLEHGQGHNLFESENDISDYVEQIGSFPKGDCLEIGLGLGVASRYILTFPLVKSVTSVEPNENFVSIHEHFPEELRGINFNYNKEKHTIIHSNPIEYAYTTNKRFDFIFLKFYSIIDEDTLPEIADVALACSRLIRPKGKMLGWFDMHTLSNNAAVFNKIFSSF